MTNKEIEDQIIEFFNENYEIIKLEGGHALAPDARELALKQILYYWKKSNEIATKVTDTEVKLSLPDKETPKGRKFTIEGVVDIVREEDETWMYDLKTHDLDSINFDLDFYKDQLNVYAHIWESLRGNPLDHIAIVSTSIPKNVINAINENNENALKKHLDDWNPLVEIELSGEQIENTVDDFGRIVDEIEERKFVACDVDVLKKPADRKGVIFATKVCRNCDGRYSCPSFREYAVGKGSRSASNFKKYFEDIADETEHQGWLTSNISEEE